MASMPPVLPATGIGRITFAEAHLTTWQANAAAIGLTAPQLAAIGVAVTEARTAYDNAQVARNASRSATQTMNNAVAEMVELLAEAIRAIKLKADQDDNPDVYALADIPAPQSPSPAGPPEAPESLVASPNADGTVTLKWQGSSANATFFSIWRKKVTDQGWTNLGSTSKKSFIDDTIPGPGGGSSATVTYLWHVRAQRQNLISMPSTSASVSYGSDGSAVAGVIGASVGGAGGGGGGGGEELSIAA
jgi:hypothetical protein